MIGDPGEELLRAPVSGSDLTYLETLVAVNRGLINGRSPGLEKIDRTVSMALFLEAVVASALDGSEVPKIAIVEVTPEEEMIIMTARKIGSSVLESTIAC
jgi:hypothetical protein